MAVTPSGKGYWIVNSAGQVFAYGDASTFAPNGTAASGTVTAFTPLPDASGYWIVNSSGDVFAYGAASASYGSVPHPHGTVTAITRFPNGLGYWVADSDGYLYALGEARSYGDVHTRHLAGGIVGISPFP